MNKLTSSDLIKKSVIFDGKTNYKSGEILEDKKLFQFYNKAIVFSDINKITEAYFENKTILINTDQSLSTAKISFV